MSYIFAGVCFIFVGIIFIQRNKFKIDKAGKDLFVNMGLSQKEHEIKQEEIEKENPITSVIQEMLEIIETRKKHKNLIDEIERRNEKKMSWYEKIITIGGYEII